MMLHSPPKNELASGVLKCSWNLRCVSNAAVESRKINQQKLMTTKFNKFKKAVVAGTCALLALASAQAVPTLRISDGINPDIIVVDGGGNDSSAMAGVVLFNGAIGNWIVNVVTTLTKPTVGSAQVPYLDLNSQNVSTGTGGTLTITFFDTDFGPTSPSGMLASIGGTKPSSGTVSYNTFVDDANVGNTSGLGVTPLTSQSFGVPAGTAYSGTAGANLPNDPMTTYALVQQVVITHGAGVQNTSFDASLTVPDGGTTVALLGFVLMGVEGLRRKLRLA